MAGTFVIGQRYTREEVADIIDLPAERRKGGSWMTGYDMWNGCTYIFTNVGTAGRTGHDYPNRWEGKQLVWYGKTHARRGQPQIDRMISNMSPVHMFWRGRDREPFTYAGNATAVEASDDTPVRVVWAFDGAAPGVLVETDAKSEAKWRRGPPPAKGARVSVKADGPTDVYLLRLHGPVQALLCVPKEHAVIKIGMSNDVARRLDELNAGFPPGSVAGWHIVQKRTLPSGKQAWEFEGERLERLRLGGYWIGGEFAVVPVSMLAGLLN